jgi:hypothetical protein
VLVLARLLLTLLAALACIPRSLRAAFLPVALALGAYTLLDGLRLAPVPPKLDAVLWLLWPGVGAALSWRVCSSSRCWAVAALLFLAYALALPFVPAAWATHPAAWALACVAPYYAGSVMSLLAWASRSRPTGATSPSGATRRGATRRLAFHQSGPIFQGSAPSTPVPEEVTQRKQSAQGHALKDRLEQARDYTDALRSARTCATILAWSSFVDVAVGALAALAASPLAPAPSEYEALAHSVSILTLSAVGIVLIVTLIRARRGGRVRRSREPRSDQDLGLF